MQNTGGLIIEGIAGTGKSSALKALLTNAKWLERGYASSYVVSEHHTQRVLEATECRRPLETADNLAVLCSHVRHLEILHGRLEEMDWSRRGRRNHYLPFIFERFHFTHVYHYGHMQWENVEEVDLRLSRLGAKVCILTMDEESMSRRIIGDSGKNGWNEYLSRYGSTGGEIIEAFRHKQDALMVLAGKSRLPVRIIDSGSIAPGAVAEEMLDFFEI